jgi:hypothetical protein
VIAGQEASQRRYETAGHLVTELAGQVAQAGVMCLIGISSSQRRLAVDMNRVTASMVLKTR